MSIQRMQKLAKVFAIATGVEVEVSYGGMPNDFGDALEDRAPDMELVGVALTFGAIG